MEEKLNAMLAADETLLWSGRPVSFKTFDNTNRKRILLGFLIKGIILALVLVQYFRLSAGTEAGARPGLILLILLFGGFAFYAPFHTARRLRRTTLYGLTDRRVLRISTKEESVPYERIHSAALRADGDGQYSLLCGPRAMKLRSDKWRDDADYPFADDPNEPEANSVILYALPVDSRLKAVVAQYLPITA